MSEFTLYGSVTESKGLWEVTIGLTTPDGKRSVLRSGFIFTSKKEAEDTLKLNMDVVLDDFTKTNEVVEVIKKTKGE